MIKGNWAYWYFIFILLCIKKSWLDSVLFLVSSVCSENIDITGNILERYFTRKNFWGANNCGKSILRDIFHNVISPHFQFFFIKDPKTVTVGHEKTAAQKGMFFWRTFCFTIHTLVHHITVIPKKNFPNPQNRFKYTKTWNERLFQNVFVEMCTFPSARVIPTQHCKNGMFSITEWICKILDVISLSAILYSIIFPSIVQTVAGKLLFCPSPWWSYYIV